MAMGGMVRSVSLRLAGDHLTSCVQRFLQDKHQLVVGENMAERIKMAIGSIDPLPEPLMLEISGKALSTASPRTMKISDSDIRAAFQLVSDKIINAVLDILESTPPELGNDIMRQGILMTGGGSLLRGLPERIARATGLPVHVDADPLTTVLRGAGVVLGDPEHYRQVLVSC